MEVAVKRLIFQQLAGQKEDEKRQVGRAWHAHVARYCDFLLLNVCIATKLQAWAGVRCTYL